MGVEGSPAGRLWTELDCGCLCVTQPSDMNCEPPQAGARFPNPKQAPEKFGSFHTECMCVPSVRLCVFLCLASPPHCRSRVVSDPIMSAQLSPGSSCPLVQLWLCHGFPFLLLLCLPLAGLWVSGSPLSNPVSVLFSLPSAPDDSACLSSSFCFFAFPASVVYSFGKPLLLLSTYSASYCVGDGG